MQISDNYAVAAVHSQEFATAAKAFIDAVGLSSGAHVNIAVLAALVSEVESRRGAQSSARGPHEAEHAKEPAAPQLEPQSAQQAELDNGCSDGKEGEDGDEGEQAARMLEAFSTLHFEAASEPVDTAVPADVAANAQHEADAHLRQRSMLVRVTTLK